MKPKGKDTGAIKNQEGARNDSKQPCYRERLHAIILWHLDEDITKSSDEWGIMGNDQLNDQKMQLCGLPAKPEPHPLYQGSYNN